MQSEADYSCVGQGDGTFLCASLHQWLYHQIAYGVVAVLVILTIVLIVMDIWRNKK